MQLATTAIVSFTSAPLQIHDEIKARPTYLVESAVGFDSDNNLRQAAGPTKRTETAGAAGLRLGE